MTGKAEVPTSLLRVRNGNVQLPFKCASNKHCVGTFSITYVINTSHHHGVMASTRVCAHGHYNIAAHKKAKVSSHLRSACVSAIKKHHHLSAKLTVTPTSGQKSVVKPIKLIL